MANKTCRLVFRNVDSQNRVKDIGRTVDSDTPVLDPSNLPAVSVTASGNSVTTDSTFFPPYTISGIPNGGVGLKGTEVSLAYDGTWEFDLVSWMSAGQGSTDPAAYADGAEINYNTATGKLSTTPVNGTTVFAYGVVDIPKDYDITRGFLPIRIGVRND